MTEVYEEEKTSMANEKSQANNLMTSLIRSASQAVLENERGDDSSRERTGLTENEVYEESIGGKATKEVLRTQYSLSEFFS